MEQTILSNIELYFTPRENVKSNYLKIVGDDVHHIAKVMRHKKGDQIHVTCGKGEIYLIKIAEVSRTVIEGWIIRTYVFENKYKNINICIPLLKNSDRFEFAIEKCAELGIPNIYIYEAKRSIPKGIKIARWQNQAIAAMKQSLGSHLPYLTELDSLKYLNDLRGKKIIFEQNAARNFIDYLHEENALKGDNYYLVFGPEGGLTEEEINTIKNKEIFRLTQNRLRSETAIITTVSLITALIQ